MIKIVTVSLGEQPSLLIEYTIGTSKRLAQRLRNAYITNPDRWVLELWKKLDETGYRECSLLRTRTERIRRYEPWLTYCWNWIVLKWTVCHEDSGSSTNLSVQNRLLLSCHGTYKTGGRDTPSALWRPIKSITPRSPSLSTSSKKFPEREMTRTCAWQSQEVNSRERDIETDRGEH